MIEPTPGDDDLTRVTWSSLLRRIHRDVAVAVDPRQAATAGRDDPAWREVVRRLVPVAKSAARYIGDPDTADDIVQDVVLRLQQPGVVAKVISADHTARYVFSMVRHSALDRYRRVARREARLREFGGELAESASPGNDDSRFSAEQFEQLREELSRLRPADQVLLRRHFIDKRTTRELAAELGLTYAATGQRIHRALAELRRALAVKR